MGLRANVESSLGGEDPREGETKILFTFVWPPAGSSFLCVLSFTTSGRMEAATSEPCAGSLRVALKNPKREAVVELRIQASASVCDLKAHIEEAYPDRPRAELITLVYAGKVLRDDVILSDVFGLAGWSPSSQSGEDVVAVHMVIKQPELRPATGSAATSETVMPTPPPPGMERVDDITVDDGVDQRNRAPGSSDLPHGPAENQPGETPTSRHRPRSEPLVPEGLTAARPSGSGSTTTVYNAVLKASYEAALRAIMENRASSHASGFTFIPAMIPVPISGMTGLRRRRARADVDGDEALEAYLQAALGPLGANEAGVRDPLLVAPRPARQGNVRNGRNHLHDGAEAENNDGNRRQFQIRIHVNVRMLFQLAVAVFIIYQHCPPSRMLTLGLVGLFFWLSTTQFGRRVLRRILQGGEAEGGNPAEGPRQRPPPGRHPEDHRGQQDQRDQPNQQGRREPPPRFGWLREIQTFVLGFLASLLPAADDAARAPGNGGVAQGL